MHIHFCTTSTDGVASFRYRVLAPANFLPYYGVKSTVGYKVDPEADWVVFSKHWTFNDVSYAMFCKLRGQRVIFDICDDHFENPKLGDHYARMVGIADKITCNSEEMKKRIEYLFPKEALVIEDPVLTKQVPYEKKKVQKLLWYGQMANYNTMVDLYPEDCEIPMEIVIPGRINPPEKLQKPWISWSQWHPNIIQTSAERCSAAFLPYPEDKQAKSANRVLEALNCGLPVITTPLPALKVLEGKGIIYIQDNLQETLETFNSYQLEEEMLEVQKLIEERYSPKKIAKDWSEVVNET